MITFDLYRLHLAPFSQERFNLHLFTPYEVQVNQRAALFAEHLESWLSEPGTYRKLPLTKKRVWHNDEWTLIKFGRAKTHAILGDDLEPREVQSWPFVYIFINNDPAVQVVAISQNSAAFHTSRTVCSLLSRGLAARLRRDQFELYFEPLFNRKNFWNFIKRNSGQVRKIRFKLVPSGLTELSEIARFDIKGLTAATGAGRAVIEFMAATEDHLIIDPDDPVLKHLVEYAAEGGGDVRVSLRGIRREFSMADEQKSLRLPEALLETPEELVKEHFTGLTLQN